MLKLIRCLGLTVISASALLACGGTTTAGGSDASAGASSVGGSPAAGGTTSSSCDVVSVAVAQTLLCAPAVSCAAAQCDNALGGCLGPNYKQGSYGTSACAQYSTCVSNCNCNSSCSNQCVMSSDCLSCLVNNVTPCAYVNCHDAVAACTAS